jgi:hypothetical protein
MAHGPPASQRRRPCRTDRLRLGIAALDGLTAQRRQKDRWTERPATQIQVLLPDMTISGEQAIGALTASLREQNGPLKT